MPEGALVRMRPWPFLRVVEGSTSRSSYPLDGEHGDATSEGREMKKRYELT